MIGHSERKDKLRLCALVSLVEIFAQILIHKLVIDTDGACGTILNSMQDVLTSDDGIKTLVRESLEDILPHRVHTRNERGVVATLLEGMGD